MREQVLTFKSSRLRLEGVLRYPYRMTAPVPTVLLIHGTLEHDRDGNMLRHPDGRDLPKRPFFRHIAKHLTSCGMATFSWDKRGYGKSDTGQINVLTLYEDAQAAFDELFKQQNIVDQKRVIVLGQSAGVYSACWISRYDDRPMAYILQGGLYSDYKAMMKFNYERPLRYAEINAENRAFVEEYDPWGLLVGKHLDDIFKAAQDGQHVLKIQNGKESFHVPCDPTCYDVLYAPSRQFCHVKKPTLILHGSEDLNVPVADADKIEAELKRCGNKSVKKVIISGTDHSFQKSPQDRDLKLRERLSLKCLKRPFDHRYFEELSQYVKEVSQNDPVCL